MSLLPAAVQPWALHAIVAVFTIGTFVHLLAPASLGDYYARWGYPRGFRFVTATLEALAAILVLLPSTRFAGLVLACLIMIAAIVTLVRAREYGRIVPAAVVLGLALVLI